MSRGVLLATICFNLMLPSTDAFISQLSGYRSYDRGMNINAATLEIPRTTTAVTKRKKVSRTLTIVQEEKLTKSESESAEPRKRKSRRKVLLKRSKTTHNLNTSPSSVKKSSSPSTSSSTTTSKRKKASSSMMSSTSSKKRKISRSSTMPGYRTDNGERRGSDVAFNDGLDILLSKSGRDLNKVNPSIIKKEKERTKKRNQDQMYLLSDSVPISLMQFVEEIHMESRITPAEEVDLGTKTQEAIRLQRLYDNLKNELKRDPTDDEWCAAAGKFNMEALRQTIAEGAEAKNRLVTSNLRMVQRVVNLYIRNGLGSQYNAGDLMQEGVMALIRAAEKFEPQRGFRFSTYAMYWIRASVKRSQISQSRIIYVPQRLHETFKKIQQREKELECKLGRKATSAELANDVGLTSAQYDRIVKAMKQKCFSLDKKLTNGMTAASSGNSKENTMYDLVVNNVEDDSEYKRLEQLFLREDLIDSLRRYLNPLEVELLLLRYGLKDEIDTTISSSSLSSAGPKTINQVSEVVGLKPDKVRRLINNSLRQLKNVIEPEWQSELA